jgi:hypothetical protein
MKENYVTREQQEHLLARLFGKNQIWCGNVVDSNEKNIDNGFRNYFTAENGVLGQMYEKILSLEGELVRLKKTLKESKKPKQK